MIYEALIRRLKHKEWSFPNIFLINSGKIQYKIAKKAIEENNFKIDVLALAKPKEEVIMILIKKLFKRLSFIKKFYFKS
jgi:excinuclease UvrABC nuclease subunit